MNFGKGGIYLSVVKGLFIYIPLGGNRKSLKRTNINLIITMLLALMELKFCYVRILQPTI